MATAFHPAFNSAQEVHALVAQRLAERVIKRGHVGREQAFAAGAELRSGTGDIRVHFRCIYRWKLNAFVHRFRWVRDFPDKVPDELLNNAVVLARAAIANPDDEAAVCAALVAFKAIRGVSVPVASAFLMAMDKDRFTIIDRQAYKTLGVSFRDGIAEYIAYLWFCRRETARLGVSLEDHDRALWQRGVVMGRKNRRRVPCVK